MQRINECDERKNTTNVNSQIMNANQYADYTVYVSKWISDLFIQKGLNHKNSKVIMSGSDNSTSTNKTESHGMALVNLDW
ncbi:hypothetical protein CM15mP35_09250 [bacterium]|nr:MAG: hypothetical protein CM15mP35_09250 [bacterium]